MLIRYVAESTSIVLVSKNKACDPDKEQLRNREDAVEEERGPQRPDVVGAARCAVYRRWLFHVEDDAAPSATIRKD